MMVSTPHPFSLLSEQIGRLTVQLDAVRDGGADSIHDARVTIRRVRALLELANGPIAGELRARMKAAGRALAAVRDADVRIELLTLMESRLPTMAAAVFPLRLAAQQTRPSLLRKTIKKLEKLELASMLGASADGIRRSLRRGRPNAALRRALAARGRETRDAIDHAGGIYFPNRIHAVRIALKKLRYGMEIATAIRTRDFSAQLRDLRKVQGVLGDLHDRQTLREDLDSAGKDAALGKTSVAAVGAVIDAEIHRLHAKYLSRRDRLRDLARSVEVERLARRWALLPAVATGMVAIASGLYVEYAYRASDRGPAVS